MSAPALVLDAQAVQSRWGFERGIPRYVTQHCREMVKIPGLVHSVCLNPTRPFPKDLDLELLYSGRLAWGGASVLRNAMKSGPLAYWIMSPFEDEASFDTLLPRAIVGPAALLLVTLYDLIPLVFPDQYLTAPETRARYTHSLDIVKMADLVLCISEHTRNDAVKYLGLPVERTCVIGAGVAASFNPETGRAFDAELIRRSVPQLRHPYIFTVLGNDPRKNLAGLLEAYMQLWPGIGAEYSLVVGGNYQGGVIDRALANCDSRIRQQICFLGRVDDDCLRAFYRSCSLFVFPSKYEGFGLPVAEALACGAPAIASRSSSTQHLLDDDVALFDPDRPADIAGCMERALTDREVRARLEQIVHRRAGEFSWTKVAQRSATALQALTAKTPSTRARTCRPAIALVGPFPPQRSGIADVNFEIARELTRLADVFLFHAGECDTAALRALGPAACLPVADLGSRLDPHYLDAVIYTLGNSPHHVETFDKVLEIPGLLWLHDIHLIDLHNTYSSRRGLPWEAWIGEVTRRMYRGRLPPVMSAAEPLTPRMLQQWGLHFTPEMVRASRGVIVSSKHAQHMLGLDQHPLSHLPRTWVIPLAADKRDDQPNVARTVPGSPLVISSFGFLGEMKAPDVLIAAVAQLPSDLNVQLNFVGFAFPEFEKLLMSHARSLGIEKQVHITGFVEESDWIGHIRNSACAVQLRLESNGESSGAVAHCLAHGLPVITSIASCAEMPQDTVCSVSPRVTDRELSTCILKLLTDEAEWERLHNGALRYARENTIEVTARRVLGAAMDLSGG